GGPGGRLLPLQGRRGRAVPEPPGRRGRRVRGGGHDRRRRLLRLGPVHQVRRHLPGRRADAARGRRLPAVRRLRARPRGAHHGHRQQGGGRGRRGVPPRARGRRAGRLLRAVPLRAVDGEGRAPRPRRAGAGEPQDAGVDARRGRRGPEGLGGVHPAGRRVPPAQRRGLGRGRHRGRPGGAGGPGVRDGPGGARRLPRTARHADLSTAGTAAEGGWSTPLRPPSGALRGPAGGHRREGAGRRFRTARPDLGTVPPNNCLIFRKTGEINLKQQSSATRTHQLDHELPPRNDSFTTLGHSFAIRTAVRTTQLAIIAQSHVKPAFVTLRTKYGAGLHHTRYHAVRPLEHGLTSLFGVMTISWVGAGRPPAPTGATLPHPVSRPTGPAAGPAPLSCPEREPRCPVSSIPNESGHQRPSAKAGPAPSRRTVLMAGAAGAVFVPALAACGGGSGGSGSGGGRLRVGVAGGSSNDTVDAHQPTDNPDIARVYNLYAGLCRFASDFTVQMALAESLEPNEEADVWTAKLKEGLTFHDGSPVNADALIFTLERITDPDRPGTSAEQLSKMKRDDLKKVDDLTVEIPFEEPYVTFKELCAEYAMGLVPEGYDPESPVGAGPFKFEELTKGERSVFSAF